MGTIVAVSVALGTVTVALMWAVSTLVITLTELSFSEILSLKLLTRWADNMKAGYSPWLMIVAVSFATLLFLQPAIEASAKLDTEAHGECTCSCRACKDTAAKVLALEERVSSLEHK